MRLSVLAFFIALPAAAYAAVNPANITTCTNGTNPNQCGGDQDCCPGSTCVTLDKNITVRLFIDSDSRYVLTLLQACF